MFKIVNIKCDKAICLDPSKKIIKVLFKKMCKYKVLNKIIKFKRKVQIMNTYWKEGSCMIKINHRLSRLFSLSKYKIEPKMKDNTHNKSIDKITKTKTNSKTSLNKNQNRKNQI